MAILVTGGTGDIGSELIKGLRADYPDENIRILDNMMRERYVSLWDLKGPYEFVEGDVTSPVHIKNALDGVETVIDLAGITNAPISFERKDLTMNVNLGGVKNVIAALPDSVRKYIYASTASVYGNTNGPENENFDCRPQSPYGESKLLAEKEIENALDGSGIDATTLRLSTVYGWSVGMRFDTVVDRFAYLACIGMPLTVWESAWNEMRPYIHVKDCLRGLMLPMKQKIEGKFNVLGQNAPLKDVIEAVKKAVPSTKVITTPASKSRASYMLDDSRIRKLGFKPSYTLEDGVREIRDKFSAFVK